MTEVVERPETKPRGRKVTHSDEIGVGQRNDLDLTDTSNVDRDTILVAADTPIQDNYLAQLKFNEEPVSIIINPQGENPENSIPAWVNGKGAEVLMDGKWVEMGYLPCEMELTIKRKTLEVLARAKKESIVTEFGKRADSGDSFNTLNRRNALQHNFTVTKDDNPIGQAWLRSIINEK